MSVRDLNWGALSYLLTHIYSSSSKIYFLQDLLQHNLRIFEGGNEEPTGKDRNESIHALNGLREAVLGLAIGDTSTRTTSLETDTSCLRQYIVYSGFLQAENSSVERRGRSACVARGLYCPCPFKVERYNHTPNIGLRAVFPQTARE